MSLTNSGSPKELIILLRNSFDSASFFSATVRSVISSQVSKSSPLSSFTATNFIIFSVPSLQVTVNVLGLFSPDFESFESLNPG